MAAIAPHKEEYESDAVEIDYANCASAGAVGLSGLSGKKCPSPLEVVTKNHSGLIRMVMTRQAIEGEIEDARKQGLSFRVQFGTASGTDKNEL